MSIALRDAGAELGDIDAAYFGNTAHGLLEGRHVATGQVALRSMGFERIPIINVEYACATGATALHQAALHVRAGAADVVIAVGVDKTSVDGKQSLLVPFNSRVDVHEAAVQAVTHKPRDYAETGGAGRRSVFMGDYADVLRAHIQSFGTTKHQLATVSQKNRAHAVHNPLAHYREAISVDEILSARSIVQPLTMPMCAPLTDGAAAAIVCNNVGLRRLADAQRIWMRATVMQSGSRRASSDWSRSISKRTADRAYEEAGVAPEDVDVAELHDDSAFGEILQTEMMGFCEIGAGGKLAESGATALGGSIATNPSGGLESKAIRWQPPGSPKSMNWCSNFAAKPAHDRSPGVDRLVKVSRACCRATACDASVDLRRGPMERGVVLGAVFHSSPLQLRQRSRSIGMKSKRDRGLVLLGRPGSNPGQRKSLQHNLYGRPDSFLGLADSD